MGWGLVLLVIFTTVLIFVIQLKQRVTTVCFTVDQNIGLLLLVLVISQKRAIQVRNS